MKTKKILSIALALALAVGMLAGCGGDVVNTKADISAFTDNDEKLEISWLGYAMLSGCEEGTASEMLLEEKFNIDLKPIFTEAATYTDKKNALLQSGDIPDMIYELDPAHVFADARDEFLFEVPYEAIEKYAPSLYANINEKAPAVWAYSYYEDKNYGLPNLNYAHMASRTVAYRADWLEKTGKEVPTTIDELHDVLYAFVHEDPDGDGKNDTYGYSAYANHWQYYFSDIFGAYGVLPFDWQEVNGEIVYGGLRQENEEVLELLAKWYKEGLIYPGFVEHDKGSPNLFKSEMVGLYNDIEYEDMTLDTSTLEVVREKTPTAEIVYSKPVKGPNGLSGQRSWGYPCHVAAFGDNGEQTPVKVTRMLKMFEEIYNDDELYIEVKAGKEGVTYTKDSNNLGTTSLVATKEYEDAAQKRLAGYEFNFSGPGFFAPFAPKEETYESTKTEAYKEWQKKYQSTELCLTDVFYKFDIVPSAATYAEDLMNQQRSLMSQIIKGEKAADQYIEEFTKIWEGTGGSTLLEEAKGQQNILDEIYKKIGLNK